MSTSLILCYVVSLKKKFNISHKKINNLDFKITTIRVKPTKSTHYSISQNERRTRPDQRRGQIQQRPQVQTPDGVRRRRRQDPGRQAGPHSDRGREPEEVQELRLPGVHGLVQFRRRHGVVFVELRSVWRTCIETVFRLDSFFLLGTFTAISCIFITISDVKEDERSLRSK